MNITEYFSSALKKIKAEGRYRVFTELKSSPSNSPISVNVVTGKNVVVWCSNDYLSMSKHPEVISALAQGGYEYGVGSGGTRNISGNSHAVVEVEKEISNLHNKERALVFTSGYVANQATLSTISKIIPNCVIFSDQNNHASIIYGIKESGLEKVIFKHNDAKDLETKLMGYPLSTPKLIVFESVYSMSGSVPPIMEFCRLAKKFNALTYVDEVHSVGIYGREGAGMCEELGVQDEVDIIQGTFAKGYGVIGGYIASKNDIVDSIRSYAPGFIFTTSLPPAIANSILTSIRYLRKSDAERLALKHVATKLKSQLNKARINFLHNNTHIVSIMIKDAVTCQSVYKELIDTYGMYVQGINFPTVPKGQERLRITPNPLHTDEMIDHLVTSLVHVLKKFNVDSYLP